MYFSSILVSSALFLGTALNADQTKEEFILPSSILEIEGDLAMESI